MLIIRGKLLANGLSRKIPNSRNAAGYTGRPARSRAAPDMEVCVKGFSGADWVNGAGRGRGQDVATMITLIFAGQLSRCRMTVSRHRGVLGLGAWVGTT